MLVSLFCYKYYAYKCNNLRYKYYAYKCNNLRFVHMLKNIGCEYLATKDCVF